MNRINEFIAQELGIFLAEYYGNYKNSAALQFNLPDNQYFEFAIKFEQDFFQKKIYLGC